MLPTTALVRRVLDGLLITAGVFVLAAATPRQPVHTTGACNTTVICGMAIPPGQAADTYINYVVRSSSQEVCFCDTANEVGGVVPCANDTETDCAFELAFAFEIPSGKSVKYKGKCYGPGEVGPADFEASGEGCGSALLLTFTLYNNETCTGTGTSMTLAGSCTATGNECTEQSCQ